MIRQPAGLNLIRTISSDQLNKLGQLCPELHTPAHRQLDRESTQASGRSQRHLQHLASPTLNRRLVRLTAPGRSRHRRPPRSCDQLSSANASPHQPAAFTLGASTSSGRTWPAAAAEHALDTADCPAPSADRRNQAAAVAREAEPALNATHEPRPPRLICIPHGARPAASRHFLRRPARALRRPARALRRQAARFARRHRVVPRAAPPAAVRIGCTAAAFSSRLTAELRFPGFKFRKNFHPETFQPRLSTEPLGASPMTSHLSQLDN